MKHGSGQGIWLGWISTDSEAVGLAEWRYPGISTYLLTGFRMQARIPGGHGFGSRRALALSVDIQVGSYCNSSFIFLTEQIWLYQCL